MYSIPGANRRLRLLYAIVLILSLSFTLYEELFLRRWLYRHLGRSSVIAGSLPNFLAVLIFSFAFALIRLPKSSQDIARMVTSIVAGLILYEVAQIWMPHRVFDWNDVAATLIGGAVAWTLIRISAGKVHAFSRIAG